jgi:hypothetical protein
MRHVWSVLCTKATIDKESNNASLFEVLEQVEFHVESVPEEPEVLPFACELLTLWTRSDPNHGESGEMRVRLLGPEGQELVGWDAKINLENHLRHRSRGALQGFKIAGEGRHEFEVSFRPSEDEPWTVVALVPLDVRIKVVQSQENTAEPSLKPI